MAELTSPLWNYNLTRVYVVDVSDDYRLMQPPLPSHYYPVLKEIWVPTLTLNEKIADPNLAPGYLYDWHERPEAETGDWYVGVVDEKLTQEPAFQAMYGFIES